MSLDEPVSPGGTRKTSLKEIIPDWPILHPPYIPPKVRCNLKNQKTTLTRKKHDERKKIQYNKQSFFY